jgi:hypothetical protein
MDLKLKKLILQLADFVTNVMFNFYL